LLASAQTGAWQGTLFFSPAVEKYIGIRN